jgi:WD40 repeat protein
MEPSSRERIGFYLLTRAVDDTGQHVAIAYTQDYHVTVFDTVSKQSIIIPIPGRGWPTVLKFTSDGNQLFVGSLGNALTLHEIESATQTKTFIGHTSGIKAVALSPNEKQIVSSEENGRVIIWDIESAMPLVSLVGKYQEETEKQVFVGSLDWSCDGQQIAAGLSDGNVQIWTLPSVRNR